MIAIDSIAYALPGRCVSNSELKAEYPDWDFERLEKRTGVLRRYVAGDGETALDFAVRACEQLLAEDRLRPAEIDATDMSAILRRHVPELGPVLSRVENAFAPWAAAGVKA